MVGIDCVGKHTLAFNTGSTHDNLVKTTCWAVPSFSSWGGLEEGWIVWAPILCLGFLFRLSVVNCCCFRRSIVAL